MSLLEGFFEKYDRLVLFDTETTGLMYNRDEIIEFAAVVLEMQNGQVTVMEEYDQLISLSSGGFVPAKIEQLTGITNQMLRERAFPRPGSAAILPGCSRVTRCCWPTMPTLT